MSSDFANAITNFSQPHTSDSSDSDHSPPTPATGGPSPQRTTPLSVILARSVGTAVEPHRSSSTKKPRGRPPGSKNKPKPPIVITRDSDSAMKPVILEISAGSDIIEMVTTFARRKRVGVTLLSGSGSVSHVTLRHPVSHAPNSLVSLHGPFHLLSLWGSFMGFKTPAAKQGHEASSGECGGGFGITLSGVQGQVFGGVVGGKVVAAGQVIVVAATYVDPPVHWLPASANGQNDAAEEQQESKPCVGECQISGEVMPWNGGSASSLSRPPHNSY